MQQGHVWTKGMWYGMGCTSILKPEKTKKIKMCGCSAALEMPVNHI